MIEGFEKLTSQEEDFMLNVPVLITIMVADADDEIEEAEKVWGEKLTRFRSVTGQVLNQDYYRVLQGTFKERLEKLLKHYKVTTLNASEVIEEIGEELKKINDIWPRIDKEHSIALYDSYLSFAEHIARASGGIFKFGSISPKEKKLLGLEMIKNPAQLP